MTFAIIPSPWEGGGLLNLTAKPSHIHRLSVSNSLTTSVTQLGSQEGSTLLAELTLYGRVKI